MADYERVICVKPEVHVFRIPPRTTNRGYRAADWKLDAPDWTGRLRIVTKGNNVFIKLEDKAGELFAQAPIESYPGIEVEAVLDSSRYFVIRIQDDSGRKAFIGIGFQDRGDSFDFNVALQDHFKLLKQQKELEKEEQDAAKNPGPKLDLGFKEGQTITINIGNKPAKSRPKPSGGGGGTPVLLPPPPGAGARVPVIPPPSRAAAQPSQPVQPQSSNNVPAGFGASQGQQQGANLLGGFSAPPPAAQQQQHTNTAGSEWGEFTSAQQSADGGGWVQF
ncbi:adaptin ear-binding coat-associated protein 1-like isoform X1 [Diadema antillarum]|uniref:adaptin ear-binding coat-associated protein 1-like isoform X1 n=1 Tax=Diadema antillarum TaxID=105358 RepID=UPI003A87833E